MERLPWDQAGPAGVSGLCPGTLRFAKQPEPPCPSPCSAAGAGWDRDVPFITVFASESQGSFLGAGCLGGSTGRLQRCSSRQHGGCQPPSNATFVGTGDMLGAGSINPTRAFGKSKDLKLIPASGCQRCPLQPQTCFAGALKRQRALHSWGLHPPSASHYSLQNGAIGISRIRCQRRDSEIHPHVQALPC